MDELRKIYSETNHENGNFVKPMLAEVPKVVGSINISHHVDCPHCDETMYDDLDREWWNSNITDQLI